VLHILPIATVFVVAGCIVYVLAVILSFIVLFLYCNVL
jgi:hypothetical protein